MKRLAALLAIVVAALVTGPLAAAQEEPPFRLPLDRVPAIPNGEGMKFFYGPWEPQGRSGGGTVTVKPGEYIHGASGATKRYRVLYEGENYVLAVVLKRYRTTWTEFEVFLLQPVFRDALDPFDSELIIWSCEDFRIKKGDTAFQWSRKRLLDEFAQRCGKGVRPGDVSPFHGSYSGEFAYGWSGSRYARPRK
ncbi:MAG: hypothetical protein IIC06_00650 [Proteobacteria bacterium]|nr:hypothetical protein [Pseudomonadota bacterium]MCH8236661.1 hypothetical protein [Pseudomonadota bacterium]